MRDSTVVWAGYTVVGAANFAPQIWQAPIAESLAKLLDFALEYQMVKGFVFTIARKESEVHSRLMKHCVDSGREIGIKGESIHSLIARLSGPSAGAPADASEGKDLPTSDEEPSDDSFDVDAILANIGRPAADSN